MHMPFDFTILENAPEGVASIVVTARMLDEFFVNYVHNLNDPHR